MDIMSTCPLGHNCEIAMDNVIRRCAWYVELQGQDAQGNEHNEFKCAIAWQPILQLEVASKVRGQTHAVESLRNENITRQDEAIKVMRDMSDARATEIT